MSCGGVKERGSEDLEEWGRVKGPVKGCGPGRMRWFENEKAGHARVPLRARFQRRNRLDKGNQGPGTILRKEPQAENGAAERACYIALHCRVCSSFGAGVAVPRSLCPTSPQ
jgi:hypothetical protein